MVTRADYVPPEDQEPLPPSPPVDEVDPEKPVDEVDLKSLSMK